MLPDMGEGKTELIPVETKAASSSEAKIRGANPDEAPRGAETEASAEQEFIQSLSVEQRKKLLTLLLREEHSLPKTALPPNLITPASAKTVSTLFSVHVSPTIAPAHIEPLPSTGIGNFPSSSSSPIVASATSSSSSSASEGEEKKSKEKKREEEELEVMGEPIDDSGYPPEEQLRRAAHRGDVGRIDTLLKSGIKPGDSLFAAAEAKNNRAFELLLTVSPDLRQKQDGYSIIEYVALYSPWSTPEKRATLEILAKQGQLLPRIHWAACLGEEEEVDREIKRGQLIIRDGKRNTTALYASANGHLSLLKLLYGRGARVTEVNEYGATALLWAAYNGHLLVVQWLLAEGGAQITEADKNGLTAVFEAAMNGHLPVVRWLIEERGVRGTEADKNGFTVVLRAASNGHLPVMKWLLAEGGAGLTEADKDGNTSLLLAASQGHLSVVKWLIQKGGVRVTEANNDGHTSLFMAAVLGHLSIVQWLLRKGGAQVTETNKGNTALHVATMMGHLPMVQWLLKEGGAQVREIDEEGNTALLLAAMKGHLPIVKWLIQEGGAWVTEANKKGNTALLWAALTGHLPIMKWLLGEGRARVIEANYEGNTALLLAASEGHLPVVQWLIQEGGARVTEVNKYSSTVFYLKTIKIGFPFAVKELLIDEKYEATYKLRGNTALLQAASQGHLPVVQWLLKEGEARVTETDEEGNTALLWAAMKGHLPVVQWLLREGGAWVGETDKQGNTALLCTALTGQLSVMQWLLKEGGARVTEAKLGGVTTLLSAAFGGHLPVVQWLLRAGGARVTETDNRGNTVLWYAAAINQYRVIRCLLFDYGVFRDKGFLKLVEVRKQLRCYLTLADSLKQPDLSIQIEALKAVLNFTGGDRFVDKIFAEEINLLLWEHECESLLAHSEWRTFEPFQALWNAWWPKHSRQEANGLTLVLSSNCWSPSKINFYQHYLQTTLSLRCLCISHSQWPTKKSWEAFLRSLTIFPLPSLDLSDNYLDDKDIGQLADAIKSNRTIRRLILDRNRLSYRGFQALLRILAAHPTLVYLSVRENHIYETDKVELDRTIGSLLRDEKCHLQTVDVSGNYFMSRGTHPARLAALRQLLRSTELTTEEFAHAEWIREKDSSKGRHLTVLNLQINGIGRDFEVPIEVMETLAAYGREEKLDTDLRKWRDLQMGLTDTLRRYPELGSVCLTAENIKENIKEQKQVCKQLLFFHPYAPLKAYLKSHRKLCSSALPTTPSLLLPGIMLTPQVWKIYFVAKKASALDEHAMLVWEGLYSYGQRMIKAAHLQAVKRGEGVFARKQIVIDYFPFDIQRGESFSRNYYMVAFTISKKRIKAMELLIEREIGELPGKYKMILSSGSVSSSDEDQKVMTNCQKWALEKLEWCLEMKEGELQKTQMSTRPSVTATNLQKLSAAERKVEVDEKAESKVVVPAEGGSKCCVM